MSESTAAKLERLKSAFAERGRVLTALSGGVDSTLCHKIAHDVLGFGNAMAVTAKSETLTQREFEEICALATAQGWNHRVIEYSELEIPNYASNPINRCYFCKHELYGRLTELARELGCTCVVEGTNYDDRGDYRPGMKAASEIGTFAPLLICELTKSEIRELAAEFGLPNWAKPSGACLSSRFPYGTQITREGLDRVAAAEEYLKGLGFAQVRVRHHDKLARIEVMPGDIARFADSELYEGVTTYLKSLGFSYVTLDLQGYRTGSMNEVLARSR
ncbi:MAG: ATP-dependent sacrificial sulfur transferase LarE [Candidatus Sumerlaeaceae bacterium]|nr:ATP-dependent sacrificial sulfur transferase LarE [Candidatus Sumerlaeaceae bacterium]